MKRRMSSAERLLTAALALTGAALLLTGCAAQEGGSLHPVALEAVQALTEVAAQLAVAMIGVAGAWAAAKIAQQSKMVNLNAAVEQVTAAAQQTVGELQQTLVETMKGASASGKLTEEQVAQLRRALLEKTESKLTAPAVNLLRAAQMDVGALICGAAEDAIARMKRREA